jgi:hypothetical protein
MDQTLNVSELSLDQVMTIMDPSDLEIDDDFGNMYDVFIDFD